MSDSTTSTVLPSVTPRRRGRPASLTVSMRKAITADFVTDVILKSTEPQTVSQIVRVIESRGCSTPTLWTDVYHFLNFGFHTFFSSGGSGTRVKWSAIAPVPSVEAPVIGETPAGDPS